MAPPGLEPVLADEARDLGFRDARAVPGGVSLNGGWPDVWRVNLWSRGATRVLVRIAEFRAPHLAQLDKRARRVDWPAFLPTGCMIQVEVTCRRSRIYHAGAAKDRIAKAIRDALGPAEPGGPAVAIRVRIDDDLCTISLDSSGDPLHRRGTKLAVGKAPLRETLAALFLRQCGFAGAEPVYDPMCGSGTIVLEAADMIAGLAPGRHRSFAFQTLPSFDADAWAGLRGRGGEVPDGVPGPICHGSDRDAGAGRMAGENACRAGLADLARFHVAAVSDVVPPDGSPGLVMVNPPYGARIGNRKLLFGVYGALGATLKARFSGWRVGLVTSDDALARAAGLPGFEPGPPIPHGGLKIRLYRTGPLP
ncbi:MAG: THUMP domain-containing class I SAM-dependent RNA methyltransferase [Marinibacterium sp.]